MSSHVNVHFVDTGKHFTANFTFSSVWILPSWLLATFLEVSGRDLVRCEKFATCGTRVLQAGLQARVGRLVQAEGVASLGGEGAVLK